MTHTRSEGIIELMREVIHKGRNRSPNRLIDLKAKALTPGKSNNISELPKLYTDWKHTRRQILE